MLRHLHFVGALPAGEELDAERRRDGQRNYRKHGSRRETRIHHTFQLRNNNISVYKAFDHQHIPEIKQSLRQLQNKFQRRNRLHPLMGRLPAWDLRHRSENESRHRRNRAHVRRILRKRLFVHIVKENIDLKQVVNMNKCLIHLESMATNCSLSLASTIR